MTGALHGLSCLYEVHMLYCHSARKILWDLPLTPLSPPPGQASQIDTPCSLSGPHYSQVYFPTDSDAILQHFCTIWYFCTYIVGILTMDQSSRPVPAGVEDHTHPEALIFLLA